MLLSETRRASHCCSVLLFMVVVVLVLLAYIDCIVLTFYNRLWILDPTIYGMCCILLARSVQFEVAFYVVL